MGQVISSLNFRFAQKLGLQENPEETDPLLQRAERYAAYWDLLTLVWLPVSGAFMVLDYSIWPIFALFASAIYLDASGREALKILSFKHEGFRIGTQTQHRVFFSIYFIMAILAITTLMFSLEEIWKGI